MDDGLVMVCPMCRVELARHTDSLRCATCRRSYPIVAGIPDLRVGGDAYLSIEDDRRKAEALAAVSGPAAEVVRAYWRATPEVPQALAERYVHHALDGPRRAEPHLDEVGAVRGSLLDVGCGTGGLLIAASRRGLAPVGVDLALRWLVVARRLLTEAGCDAVLVAADGAILPFPRHSFDVVTCIEVLEHAPDQRGLLHSTLEAVRPDGVGYLVTANRYSLAPDPTVGLWGVGFLPHPLAVRYVARRRNTRYAFMHPRSRSELRAMLGPDAEAHLGAAPLPGPPTGASHRRMLAQAFYDRARRSRVAAAALVTFGPYLQVRRR
jgi:SAM-dependent methyltransferase